MFDLIPKRYVFALVGLSATTLAIVLQSNLSMAIVYMVQRPHSDSSNNTTITKCHRNQHVTDNFTRWEQQLSYGEFDWSPQVQGMAIGVQFIGIIFGCIPGGRLAEVYGSKITLISTLLLASFSTALLPSAAYLSIYAFMLCRVMVGVGISPVFPVLVYMISRWIPVSEQSLISSFMLAGYGTGTFISYVTAGFLCSSTFLGGWPSVFYLSALSGLIWSVWAYFVLYDEPSRHPNICSKEQDYIIKHTSPQTKKVKLIPFKSLVTSIPLWALAVGAFGQFWIMAFFATSLALYMGTILNLESVENGYVSCVPNLLRAIFACIVGVLIDHAMRKRSIPIGYIRKGATLANSVAAVVGFIGVLYAECDITLNAIWFIIACITNDFTIFGVCLVPVDMAPNLSGTISGMLNFVVTLPYIILTILIGHLTQQEQSFKQWSYIYYWSIGVLIVSTTIFLIFGTSDLQEWALDNEEVESETTKDKPQECTVFHIPISPKQGT